MAGSRLGTFQSILALGAHPDDIEYGCYGHLLKQKKQGAQISAFIASLGSKGDPSSGLGRKHESTTALHELTDGRLYFREEVGLSHNDFSPVIDQVFGLIQTLKPDLILTQGQHDTHQEHRLLYEITLAAARRSTASILAYGILSNTLEFMPHLFVDISAEFEEKKTILRKHLSQKDKYYMSEQYLEIFHSHNYASLHGLRHCEAYEVVRLFL